MNGYQIVQEEICMQIRETYSINIKSAPVQRSLTEICIDADENKTNGQYLFNLKEEVLTSFLGTSQKNFALEHIQGYIEKLRAENKRKRIKDNFDDY